MSTVLQQNLKYTHHNSKVGFSRRRLNLKFCIFFSLRVNEVIAKVNLGYLISSFLQKLPPLHRPALLELASETGGNFYQKIENHLSQSTFAITSNEHCSSSYLKNLRASW